MWPFRFWNVRYWASRYWTRVAPGPPPPLLPAAGGILEMVPIPGAILEMAPIPWATLAMAPIPGAILLMEDAAVALAAGEAWLEWDLVTNPAVTGLRLYHGTVSGVYGTPVSLPASQTTYIATALAPGDHYFIITAVTATAESDVSGEIHVVI